MSPPLRIALAELRSTGATLALLVALVAVAAGTVVAAPQAVTRAASLELSSELDALTENQRNLTGQTSAFEVIASTSLFGGPPASIDAAYGPLQRALAEHRDDQPEPLRSALGDADIVVIGEPAIVLPAEPRDDDPRFLIRGIADPAWEQRLALVDGRLPAPWDLSDTPEPSGDTLNGVPVDPFLPPPLEIALTPQGAEALRWSLGEQRLEVESNIPVVLVGLVDPLEPDSAYWQRLPAAPDAERFDDGNQQPRETAAAFVHPLSLGAPATLGPVTVQYPLDTDRLDAATVDEVLPQLRSFIASELRVPFDGDFGSGTAAISFTSAVPAAAGAVLDRVGVTQAVLALTVAGPLGALGVVTLLAARAAIERRRGVLALRLARGASRRRLQVGVVASTLGLTVPAALVGAAAATAASAALTGMPLLTALAVVAAPALLAVLAATALAPAIVLAALVPRPSDVRERRADLVAPGRARAVLDLVVVVLAAVSVWFVLQRGVVASAGAVGIDPLLVAMPLLVALAASVVVVRLYPALLGLARAVGATGRSAIAAIGARRASRDRSVSSVLVVASLVATAVAVSSLSVLADVDDGLDSAARDWLGAAVRVSGPAATGEFAIAAESLPEVGVVGGVDLVGPAVLSVESVRENATVITVDAGAAGLRSDLPDGFGDTATADGDRIPVVMSADLLRGDALPAPDASISVDGVPVTVVATGRPADGYGVAGSWVIVATVDAARFTGRPAVDTVLVEPADGVAPTAAAAALAQLADDRAAGDARITVATQLAADERAAPLTTALRTALLAGAALAALLGIAALGIAAVVGRPRRQRVQALAHVLGVRRSSALVAWELAPPTLVGVLAGAVAGVGLVPLALAAADLRAVTGQAEAVRASLDPLLIVATAGGIAAAALAVIAVATLLDRRPPLLTALRTESS